MKSTTAKRPAQLITALIVAGLFTTACQNGNNSQAGNSNAAPEVEAKTRDMGQASVKDSESQANILDVAISSDAHTTLVKAVQAAEIEHILVNAGPLTVFAPTNAAFEKLPEETLQDLLKPENKAQLAEILTRHAAPGKFDVDDLKKEASKGRTLFMATSDYLEIQTGGDKVQVGGVAIQQTIPASNGVIHVVNEVILP